MAVVHIHGVQFHPPICSPECKTNPSTALNTYFRQDSVFRSTADVHDNRTDNKTGRFFDIDDDLLQPECASNVKTIQTDFSSNESTSFYEYLAEFDPLCSDIQDNPDPPSERKCSNISIPSSGIEELEDNTYQEDIFVSLGNDSIDDGSDRSHYKEEDLQKGLPSSAEIRNQSREIVAPVNVYRRYSKETEDFLHLKIEMMSEKVKEMIQSNNALLQQSRFVNRCLMHLCDDSSDEDDEDFVNIPNNVLKQIQFSKSYTDLEYDNTDDSISSRGRWSVAKTLKKKGRKQSAPYTLVMSFTPSQRPISNILSNRDGSIWVTFQNSNLIALYDYHGNVIDVVDVRTEVDDITSSGDGTLFMSCPRDKRIKVLTRTMQFNTLLVTPSFVRGITIDPAGDFLIACIVPNLTNQPEVDCGSHGACVIRYFIQRHCVTCPRNAESGCSQFLSNPNRGSRRPRCICSQNIHCVKGSKVTRENLFQYPFRVVASTNGDIAVSDHGNKTVWLLSNTGTLLGSYNQSCLRIYTNHGLTFDTNNDLLIVQSGLRNIIRIRRYVDGSTSVKKYAVSELESQTVTAAAVDSRGSLIVVMGRALIKVLLKKSSNGLKR